MTNHSVPSFLIANNAFHHETDFVTIGTLSSLYHVAQSIELLRNKIICGIFESGFDEKEMHHGYSC